MTATRTHDNTLTVADRCDRCGAQAVTRIRMPSGLELFFCGHHTRAHRAQLDAQALELLVADIRPEPVASH